jgi:hypothetical protein
MKKQFVILIFLISVPFSFIGFEQSGCNTLSGKLTGDGEIIRDPKLEFRCYNDQNIQKKLTNDDIQLIFNRYIASLDNFEPSRCVFYVSTVSSETGEEKRYGCRGYNYCLLNDILKNGDKFTADLELQQYIQTDTCVDYTTEECRQHYDKCAVSSDGSCVPYQSPNFSISGTMLVDGNIAENPTLKFRCSNKDNQRKTFEHEAFTFNGENYSVNAGNFVPDRCVCYVSQGLTTYGCRGYPYCLVNDIQKDGANFTINLDLQQYVQTETCVEYTTEECRQHYDKCAISSDGSCVPYQSPR